MKGFCQLYSLKPFIMENNYPYVRLFKEQNFEGTEEYILHSVTFFNRTNYRADGHEPVPSVPTAGAWEIRLKVRKDPELPDHEGLTPVVHTLVLGSLPEEMGDVLVKVSVTEELPETQEESKPKAVSTVSTTSASEESRPAPGL